VIFEPISRCSPKLICPPVTRILPRAKYLQRFPQQLPI
jgi:hypothetical protein